MKTASLTPTRLDCSRMAGSRAAALNLAATLAADTTNWFNPTTSMTPVNSRCQTISNLFPVDYMAFIGGPGLHRASPMPDWIESCPSWNETTAEMLPDAITKILSAWKRPQPNSSNVLVSWLSGLDAKVAVHVDQQHVSRSA